MKTTYLGTGHQLSVTNVRAVQSSCKGTCSAGDWSRIGTERQVRRAWVAHVYSVVEKRGERTG